MSNEYLDAARPVVEAALDAVMPCPEDPPQRLHHAMHHAVRAGGKRLRPILTLACGEAVAGAAAARQACPPVMAAIELLHTYTLVHDDLPAMDDDDLRRGQPSCHIAFDEATAILTGDALLTLALGTAATCTAAAVRCLAEAAGSHGVVGGQQDDLDAERGRLPDADRAALVERIHRRKTAALIRAACELGAIAVGADPNQRQALAEYGEALGLAFQITDDILDVTATSAELGKTAGKDAARGKLTYVSVHGLDAARQRAEECINAAHKALTDWGPQADHLRAIATAVAQRRH